MVAMSHPWETCGAFYPKRDARNYLPIGGYSFTAAETKAAKDRSRSLIVDQESLKVRIIPVTRKEAEVGIDWTQIPV